MSEDPVYSCLGLARIVIMIFFLLGATATRIHAESVEVHVRVRAFLSVSSVVPLCLSGILPQFLHLVSPKPRWHQVECWAHRTPF